MQCSDVLRTFLSAYVAAFAKDLLSARDELQELSFFLVALQPVPLQMIFCSRL